MARRRLRLWHLLAFVAALLLPPYVWTYYLLSRRGMAEARKYNLRGFLYVPLDDALKTQDLSRHHARMRLYAPLNWIDQKLFDAPGPVAGFTWGLSKSQDKGELEGP